MKKTPDPFAESLSPMGPPASEDYNSGPAGDVIGVRVSPNCAAGCAIARIDPPAGIVPAVTVSR